MSVQILQDLVDNNTQPTVTAGIMPARLKRGTTLVLGVDSQDGVPRVAWGDMHLDPQFVKQLDRSLSMLEKEWSEETARTIPALGGPDVEMITLVGLGDATLDNVPTRLRRAAGAAARSASRAEHLIVALPSPTSADTAAIIEGMLLGSQKITRLKSGLPSASDPDAFVTIHLVTDDARVLDSQDVRVALAGVDAVRRARGLVNLPPNILYPSSFAEYAQALSQVHDHVSATVWDNEQLISEGFGGIVGVGQGSAREPRLVRVAYEPAGATRRLALVGKGITYDSGGLNLKPTALDYMHFDMAGAASVLSAVLAVAGLGLPIAVVGWLALAENMPSGTAQRPSDVITMRDGSTVEVRDTDAEGRLVLADAIAEACLEGPEVLVDLATLTGAQEIALGSRIAGLMTNDDELAEQLNRVAEYVDEPHWRMPLPRNYKYALRSSVADLANIADRPGGMISAGVFLQQFVNRAAEVPRWAHIDIAGPGINRNTPYGFTPLGATGVGVRTMIGLAVDLAT